MHQNQTQWELPNPFIKPDGNMVRTVEEWPQQQAYLKQIRELADKVRRREQDIRGNIFLSKDDHSELTNYLKGFYQEMALTREEIGKLDG